MQSYLEIRELFVLILSETPASWKWEKRSIIHRQKFIDLHEYAKTHPNEIKEVNGVRVCCTMENFLLGKGCDGTRVYVGLAKDGVEKAVKRLPRDCYSLAEQEKEIFERSTMKSNHVVKYWCLVDQDGNEHLYLILDLCEETLEDFVKRSSGADLVTCAPDIIQQILRGLADLHRNPKPILHRDLKPSNILRDIDGNWLLADFGISRILTEDMTTHVSKSRGTEFWKAVKSCSSKSQSDEVCYMKESDIQVGLVNDKYLYT
jgi:serine/threonine protein kinase